MERSGKVLATSVTALCVVSIAASCLLALSYVTLKGMNDLRPLSALVVFIAEAAVTLFALNVMTLGFGLDVIALAGAFGLTWFASSLVVNALASSHFEGYAVLLGGIGVLQGSLTLILFGWRLATGPSPRAIG
jgi:hypothetical protein